MVEFCPKCDKMLRKKKEGDQTFLACISCDYKKVLDEETSKKLNKPSNKKLEKKIATNKTRVIDEKTQQESIMTKTQKTCPKCENIEAEYEQYQTRSADEPATTFFRCTKCGHRWREY